MASLGRTLGLFAEDILWNISRQDYRSERIIADITGLHEARRTVKFEAFLPLVLKNAVFILAVIWGLATGADCIGVTAKNTTRPGTLALAVRSHRVGRGDAGLCAVLRPFAVEP